MIETTYTDFLARYARAKDDVDAAHDAALVLNCDFWTCDDCPESLNCSTMEDAVSDFFSAWGTDEATKIDVVGYRRKKLDECYIDPETILERILEDLDEEHGDPDERTEPTPGMLAAAKVFAKAIRDEYKVWQCDEAVRVSLTEEEVRNLLRDDADLASFV